MAIRLLEVYHSPDEKVDFKELLGKIEVIDLRHLKVSRSEILTRILLPAGETEKAVETLDRCFSKDDKYRIIISSPEATIPRPQTEEAPPHKKEEKGEIVSIEEVYQDIADRVRPSLYYYVFVFLSAIVASVGILYNNVAVIIGLMVIAPLLTPNMGLSLGTTLADRDLMKSSLITSLTGYAVAFAVGVVFGVLFGVDPRSPEILSRIDLSLMYVLLALACGVAGSLSLVEGAAQPFVGVMIAVALLPPLVAGGLLFGSGRFPEALRAVFLFLINVVSINLAGVLTFLLQGITPRKWWEKRKAKKVIKRAIILWLAVLAVIVAIILLYEYTKK